MQINIYKILIFIVILRVLKSNYRILIFFINDFKWINRVYQPINISISKAFKNKL